MNKKNSIYTNTQRESLDSALRTRKVVKTIKVEGHERVVYNTPPQLQMDQAFQTATALLNLADRHGVTARDKTHARIFIGLIKSKFGV